MLPTASGFSVRQLAFAGRRPQKENPSQGNSKCAKQSHSAPHNLVSEVPLLLLFCWACGASPVQCWRGAWEHEDKEMSWAIQPSWRWPTTWMEAERMGI